jgi:hypothetical protein
LDYEIPEDFYCPVEFGEFCRHTHKLVESLCEHLDQLIFKFHPDLRSQGMAPFRFHIIRLLQVFDGVRGRVFQLQRIFKAYPTLTACIHMGRSFRWSSDDLFFSNQETLWAQVASLPGWGSRIEILAEPDLSQAQTTSRRNQSSIEFFKRRILKSLWLTSGARLWSLRNYQGLLNLMRKDRAALLLIGAPYEWTQVLPILSGEGRKILFTSKEYFETRTDEDAPVTRDRFDQVESDPDLMSCFHLGTINYFPLLKERLSWIWRTSPKQFASVARKVAQLKNRHKISAVLRCSSSSGIEHSINQSARSLGIPVFLWQHGAVSHDTRITQFRDYADAMTSDYTFVYGREAEKAYTRHGQQFSSRVMAVGATTLDSMRATNKHSKTVKQTLHQPRKKLVYATTNYMQNHWYGGWMPVFSDREYYRDQEVVARYLSVAAEKGLSDIIVKLHPSREYQEPPWAERLRRVSGIRVVKDEDSFENLLKQSAAVVLDFPSTTLLQSIAMGVPVFVLTQRWPFPTEGRAMLKERVVAADNAKELITRLEEFLESDSYPADLTATSFLQAYGNYLNDGKSAQRALEILSKILEKGILDSTTPEVRQTLANKSARGFGLHR